MDKQDELVDAIRSHFATDIAAREVAAAIRSFMGSDEVVERVARIIAQNNSDAAWRIVGLEAPDNAFDLYKAEGQDDVLVCARAALSAAIGADIGGGRG